jgi:NADPH-dependent glutamate synthase beta subunit-like oxidoreductase
VNKFNQVFSSGQVKLFTQAGAGEVVSFDCLEKTHDAIVLCTGASSSNPMQVPGEGLCGSFSADQVVGWYNGDPNYADLDISLRNVRNVVIVGHGTVALDIARILLKRTEQIKYTSISPKALRQLSQSSVEHVSIVGRRGPLQVCFQFKLI